jgi:hypothetical protein
LVSVMDLTQTPSRLAVSASRASAHFHDYLANFAALRPLV